MDSINAQREQKNGKHSENENLTATHYIINYIKHNRLLYAIINSKIISSVRIIKNI